MIQEERLFERRYGKGQGGREERDKRHLNSAVSPIVGPRVPIGRPVGSQIGAWADGMADAREILIIFVPHAQIGDVYERVGILRFIQRQDDGTGHFSRHGKERAGRDCRWIQKIFLQSYETTFRPHEVHRRLERRRQREL